MRLMNILKDLKKEEGIFKIKLNNFNNKEFEHQILRKHKDQWPITFDTATFPMNDFIGNVTKINNNICSVRGHYMGKMREIDNVKIIDPAVIREGQRIMISEHVNINGQMELVATTKRIIEGKFANVNFTNVGWSDDKSSEYIRVDIHTGECKAIKDKANYSNYV